MYSIIMWNENSENHIIEEIEEKDITEYETDTLQKSFLQISSYLYSEGINSNFTKKKYDIEEGIVHDTTPKQEWISVEEPISPKKYNNIQKNINQIPLYYYNLMSFFTFWMFYYQIHKPVRLSRETENGLSISFIYFLHMIYSFCMYNGIFRSSIVMYKSFERCISMKKRECDMKILFQEEKLFLKDICNHSLSIFQSSILSIPIFITIKVSPLSGLFSFGCMALIFAEYLVPSISVFLSS